MSRKRGLESVKGFGLPVRRWVQNLALVVGSVFVGLGFAEIATRTFSEVRPPFWEPHPVLGKIYRPGLEEEVHIPESGREVLLRFNRDGFRGPNLPHVKGPDVRRIAVVGDSFVAAIACDEEDTAVRHLERLLTGAHPGFRWEVQNFGISGSSTAQEIVVYREVVRRYKPDLVVGAYATRNDFADNSSELTSGPRVYFRLDQESQVLERPRWSLRFRLGAWLNRHSRLYVWWKQANDFFRIGKRSEAGRRIFFAKPGPDLERTWELNTRLIATFSKEVETDGSRFVLAMLPAAEQIQQTMWQDVLDEAGDLAASYDPDYPDRRLGSFCRQRGIPWIGMTESFRSAARAGELLYFQPGGHFNEVGNRRAAEAIFRFLEEGAGRRLLEQILMSDGRSEP